MILPFGGNACGFGLGGGGLLRSRQRLTDADNGEEVANLPN